MYFFHTTSWKGSLKIIDKVDRMNGRKCLDFGIYPGFYMSQTALDCLDWGVKKSRLLSNEVAIMIFSIPLVLPDHIAFKELRGLEWTNITKLARRCAQTDELRSIRSIDLLYGNMVSNSTAVENGSEIVSTHRPPKKQLVSKTDAADKFIHECLTGCIYFRKSAL